MGETSATPKLAEGRSCAGCTMCCKLMGVAELSKPPQQWCSHCEIGVGCKAYDARPDDCRTFYCGWVLDPRIADAWRPDKSRMVVKFEVNRISILVDKDRRDAWRREPFNAQIRAWARVAAMQNGEVLVWEGTQAVRVFPAGEQKLA